MKSYLSLIPISAKVRRRQNRMTILCIVIAVFLVSAIFSVADMMLRTQMNRAAGKDGSWHLQIAGITQSQAEQLAQQPDVVCTGAGAVFNEGGEEDYRLNGKRVATPEGYARNPELVINFYNERRKQLLDESFCMAAENRDQTQFGIPCRS